MNERDLFDAYPCLGYCMQNKDRLEILQHFGAVAKAKKIPLELLHERTKIAARVEEFLEGTPFTLDELETITKSSNKSKVCKTQVFLQNSNVSICTICCYSHYYLNHRETEERMLLYAICSGSISCVNLPSDKIDIIFSSKSMIAPQGIRGNWPIISFHKLLFQALHWNCLELSSDIVKNKSTFSEQLLIWIFHVYGHATLKCDAVFYDKNESILYSAYKYKIDEFLSNYEDVSFKKAEQLISYLSLPYKKSKRQSSTFRPEQNNDLVSAPPVCKEHTPKTIEETPDNRVCESSKMTLEIQENDEVDQTFYAETVTKQATDIHKNSEKDEMNMAQHTIPSDENSRKQETDFPSDEHNIIALDKKNLCQMYELDVDRCPSLIQTLTPFNVAGFDVITRKEAALVLEAVYVKGVPTLLLFAPIASRYYLINQSFVSGILEDLLSKRRPVYSFHSSQVYYLLDEWCVNDTQTFRDIELLFDYLRSLDAPTTPTLTAELEALLYNRSLPLFDRIPSVFRLLEEKKEQMIVPLESPDYAQYILQSRLLAYTFYTEQNRLYSNCRKDGVGHYTFIPSRIELSGGYLHIHCLNLCEVEKEPSIFYYQGLYALHRQNLFAAYEITLYDINDNGITLFVEEFTELKDHIWNEFHTLFFRLYKTSIQLEILGHHS